MLFVISDLPTLCQSTRARRLKSDDVDAVGRLPLLNESYYQDILCEIGGMFAIANSVDNIHKRPWIGFQSWRAAGRKVYLMAVANIHTHTQRKIVTLVVRILIFWCSVVTNIFCSVVVWEI